MPLHVKILSGNAEPRTAVFQQDFTLGRHGSCDIRFQDNVVSRFHAEVSFDGQWWWLKDLHSRNGTFLNGQKISLEKLPDRSSVQLGQGGPVLEFLVQDERPARDENESGPEPDELESETQIIRHFFEGADGEQAGEKTLMFRRAFRKAHKKKSRKYLALIAVSVLLLSAAAGVIYYQKDRISRLRATAIDIFYSMKVLELQIAHLEDLLSREKAAGARVAALRVKKDKFHELEQTYERFVKDLGVYQGLPPQDRVILKVARIFGECDVNVPKGFSMEVKKYIDKWRRTGRLKRAMDRAIRKGYDRVVTEIFSEYGVTPYFLFLGLQESGFNEKAIGPKTRYGYAKGAWQFIPMTAKQYGLKLGPLYKKRKYDPLDQRFNFVLATRAAAKYIRDLYNTEAQASGLLVMAAYNWGHNRVRKIIRRMPEDPRKRNFWHLLQFTRIPKETYDYIFYIFSAAVVCEDPALFGFDMQCGSVPGMEGDGVNVQGRGI